MNMNSNTHRDRILRDVFARRVHEEARERKAHEHSSLTKHYMMALLYMGMPHDCGPAPDYIM